MSIYNWESNPKAFRKKVKKTGTVVFHPQGDVETSFARVLQPQSVCRANPFGVDAENDPLEKEETKVYETDAKKKGEERSSTAEREEREESEVEEEEEEKQSNLKPHPSQPTMPLITHSTVERLQNIFGFTELLPSQAQCYKGIFLRRDVILHSRTGSGKTLAYALPIVERYLLFKAKMKEKYPNEPLYQDDVNESTDETLNRKKGNNEVSKASSGPFLLIFVFSVDLAVQTKTVLSRLYPQLRIEVPGYHETVVGTPTDGIDGKEEIKKSSKQRRGEVASPDPSSLGKKDTKESPDSTILSLNKADILVGTVHAIDSVIRGHRIAAEALQKEQMESNGAERRQNNQKRTRSSEFDMKGSREDDSGRGKIKKEETKEAEKAKFSPKKKCEEKKREDSDDEDELNSSDEEEFESNNGVVGDGSNDGTLSTNKNFEGGVVSAARVQAIVIDEVDSTLGPHFSFLGRRMKNLLKYIRRSNGALSSSLLTDYRAHHYILCGATIPNWVIKAGFLGVKKYYYRLVQPGTQKLPEKLGCYYVPCPLNLTSRVQKVQELLKQSETAIKEKKHSSKGQQLSTPSQTSNHFDSSSPLSPSTPFLGRVVVFGTNKQIEALSAALKATSSTKSISTVCTLTSRLPESDRIRSIATFNDSTDASATLLCTDIASRGLDVSGADTILMMSLPLGPMAVETFIHRAGRTARVNRTGRCIVLLADAVNSTSGHGKSSLSLPRSPSPVSIHQSVDEERNTYDRVVQAVHVTFQHFDATIGGKVDQRAQLQLEVRRPFLSAPPPNAPPLPTASEVLKKELSSSAPSTSVPTENLFDLVENIKEDAKKPTEKVSFFVPTSKLHLIRKKLWKYELKEL